MHNVTTTLLQISEPASLFILGHCEARIVLIMIVMFFFFIFNFMRMARVPFRVGIDMIEFRTFIKVVNFVMANTEMMEKNLIMICLELPYLGHFRA